MAEIQLKNPAVQKVILAALLGGGLLALFFFTHYLPFSYPSRRDAIQSLRSELERKSTELARARASVADLPRFESEFRRMNERWHAAAELLPADRQLAALLRKVSLAGQQTGVDFVMFKPAPQRSEGSYIALPVEITVSGGYHQVGTFLAELTNLRRIVNVSDLRLAGSTRGDGPTTQASFTATAYSLATHVPPTDPAPAKEGS